MLWDDIRAYIPTMLGANFYFVSDRDFLLDVRRFSLGLRMSMNTKMMKKKKKKKSIEFSCGGGDALVKVKEKVILRDLEDFPKRRIVVHLGRKWSVCSFRGERFGGRGNRKKGREGGP